MGGATERVGGLDFVVDYVGLWNGFGGEIDWVGD